MVGRDITTAAEKRATSADGLTSEVLGRSLSNGSYYRDISFSLRRGDVIGIAGVKTRAFQWHVR
jgi:ABC-type sugar transport system ATPase subunit